jgi:hypothetical protein
MMYFCIIKLDKTMEEHKYPKPQQEEKTDLCKEPISVTSATSISRINSTNDGIEDIDWEKIPNFGPFTEEEALARIEQAEADLNDPSKWINAEDFNKELLKSFPWLR